MSNRPAFLGANSIIGAESRPCLDGTNTEELRGSKFGQGVWVGHNCILHDGIAIGDRTIIGDGCIIEGGSSIGANALLTYRAHICEQVSIGDRCIIGGFVGERAIIKSDSRVFGSIVHHHLNPTLPWDAPSSMEGAATVHEYVMIGFGAIITKMVSIGPRAYVCAGAIISRDVPPLHIAFGRNQVCRFDQWKGPLRDSPLFR